MTKTYGIFQFDNYLIPTEKWETLLASHRIQKAFWGKMMTIKLKEKKTLKKNKKIKLKEGKHGTPPWKIWTSMYESSSQAPMYVESARMCNDLIKEEILHVRAQISTNI